MTELRTEEFGDDFDDLSESSENAGNFVADVTIESDLELRLPPEYVPNENERITLYRQLDAMERTEQVEEFRKELRDRFGKIPPVSEELVKVVELRILARKSGFERIVLKNGAMRAYFVSSDNEAYYHSRTFAAIMRRLQENPAGTRLKELGDRSLLVVENVGDVSTALKTLESLVTSSRP